jgi:isoleucyl-tRNA synthetase
VHLALFPNPDEIAAKHESLLDHWKNLLAFRDSVLVRLEELRKEKKIGKSLEARVSISATGSLLKTLRASESELKELLNVSQVSVEAMSDSTAMSAATIAIAPADGQKCERCWNYYADDGPQHVRQYGPWSNVCGRCAEALNNMGYASLQESHA